MFTPSKTEFLRLAQQGNLIPVYREILADTETPVTAYQKIRKRGPSFLLESVEGGEYISRYSFLGANPHAVIRVEQVAGSDPLLQVEAAMAQYRPVTVPGLPRFAGGAVGFLGYEYIHAIEPSVPLPARNDLGTPVLCFMITDALLIFDRVSQTIKVVANAHVTDSPEMAYAAACATVDEIIAQLGRPLPVRPVEFRRDAPDLPVTSNITPERYAGMVAQTKEYIKAGDAIQTVLAQRFEMPTMASALEIYRALRSVNLQS